jgi:membrane carboxypeptidase/penicillin-binding protein
VSDVDPRFVEMLQTYEDRRFRKHWGVDPLAMARAAFQFISNCRIISGGSDPDHAGRSVARAALRTHASAPSFGRWFSRHRDRAIS